LDRNLRGSVILRFGHYFGPGIAPLSVKEDRMPVHMELASPRAGEWYVVSEGTYLVGFRGIHARELAVRQQRELTELFNAAAAEAGTALDRTNPTVSDD
jgi:hypothetical protein